MKHYFNPMSRAVTTHWMLAELDAPHEQVVVDIHGGENHAPAYRAINPMGKVPALVDGDVVVTETAAICAYLADKHAEVGLAPAPGTEARGRYYRYLFFTGQTLEPLLTLAQHEVTGLSPSSAGWGDMERCLATVESMTPETGWALGERFTAADVVFGGMLEFSVAFGLLPSPSPRVTAYVERIRARPMFRETHPRG